MRDTEELDALIYPVEFDTSHDQNTGSYPPSSGRYPRSQPDILGEILVGCLVAAAAAVVAMEVVGDDQAVAGAGQAGAVAETEVAVITSAVIAYLHDLADQTGARLYQAEAALRILPQRLPM